LRTAFRDRLFRERLVVSGDVVRRGRRHRRGCVGRLPFPPDELMNSATFRFARAASYIIMNVYAVFMISTSTVVIRTGSAPRWIAFL